MWLCEIGIVFRDPGLLDFITEPGDGEGEADLSSSSSEFSIALPRPSRDLAVFLVLVGGEVVMMIGAPFVRL